MKFFSKLGLWLVCGYAVFTGIFFAVAFTAGGFAPLLALIPILPWSILLEHSTNFNNMMNNPVGIFIFIFINTSVIYLLGVILELSLVKNINK